MQGNVKIGLNNRPPAPICFCVKCSGLSQSQHENLLFNDSRCIAFVGWASPTMDGKPVGIAHPTGLQVCRTQARSRFVELRHARGLSNSGTLEVCRTQARSRFAELRHARGDGLRHARGLPNSGTLEVTDSGHPMPSRSVFTSQPSSELPLLHLCSHCFVTILVS
jgi:hypothetical protein